VTADELRDQLAAVRDDWRSRPPAQVEARRDALIAVYETKYAEWQAQWLAEGGEPAPAANPPADEPPAPE
jgi:hypothetical protein